MLYVRSLLCMYVCMYVTKNVALYYTKYVYVCVCRYNIFYATDTMI